MGDAHNTTINYNRIVLKRMTLLWKLDYENFEIKQQIKDYLE